MEKEIEDLYIAVSEFLCEIFTGDKVMYKGSPEVQALYRAEVGSRQHFRKEIVNFSTRKRLPFLRDSNE